MTKFDNQVANQILEAQQRTGQVSHAYLFVGEHEQSEFAIYAAQALLCQQKKIGACTTCSACLRVQNHQHADFVYLSGKDTSIKKEDIIKLQDQFQQSALESSARQVYIIEAVENATVSAMNSLLKFLEEPKANVTAILTTSSESRVLETIRSRCLIIGLKEEGSETLFHDLVASEYDLLDAYYLSKLFPSLKAIEIDTQYNHVADFAKEFIQDINQRKLNTALVKLQAQTSKFRTMDRDGFVMFLDVLSLSYSIQGNHQKDVLSLTNGPINKIAILEIITDMKDRIRPGVNLGLVVDQFAYQMSKGNLYD